jgi:hypothetical protein
MKYILTALLAVASISLGTCNQLQSNTDGTDPNSRSSSSGAPVIADSDNTSDAGLPSPGQDAADTNLMLPFVAQQSTLPGAAEITVDIQCTDTNPHPIGQSISESYAISYQQVMTWFCSGYSFEDILVALETSAAADFPTDTLLKMSLEKGWEEIWDEIGFIENR